MVECIVTSESVHQMIETVAYLAELGVKVLKIEPVHISKISRGGKAMVPTPKDFVDNFAKMLKYVATNKLKLKVDTGFFSRPSTDAYCWANGRNLIITPAGDITSCVEVTKKSDPFGCLMVYGRVLVETKSFWFMKTL